ncbi:hypothetical protein ABIB59_001042 [Citrobacter sp. UYEF32]
MAWTDAIRDVDSCRMATDFLMQTLGLHAALSLLTRT